MLLLTGFAIVLTDDDFFEDVYDSAVCLLE